jgi:hypothetical protein
MFGNQQRLETTVTVARRLDPDLAITGQHRLGRAAIALVGDQLGSFRAGLVAHMVAQLRVQRGLHQRLLEYQASFVDRLAGHRTGQEKRHLLLRNRRKLGYVTHYFLRSARHNTLLRAGYASHIELPTGSRPFISRTKCINTFFVSSW